MGIFKSKRAKAIDKIKHDIKDMTRCISDMNAKLDVALNKECPRDCQDCPQKDCPTRGKISRS